MLAASQRGDDKTRVGLAAGPLGLADDAARPAPAIQRRPGKVLEAPCRLAGLLAVLARGGQFGSDRRREARILGQAEEEVDAIVLAPMHQLLAGKPGIGAQQDTHPRPAGAEVADDARHLLDRPGAGVDVGTAQFGRQEVPVAEDVKRQVAVAIVNPQGHGGRFFNQLSYYGSTRAKCRRR